MNKRDSQEANCPVDHGSFFSTPQHHRSRRRFIPTAGSGDEGVGDEVASLDYAGPGRIMIGYTPLVVMGRARPDEVRRAETLASPHEPVLVGGPGHLRDFLDWIGFRQLSSTG